MHPEHQRYAKFTSKARIEKAINSLLGLVEGARIGGNVEMMSAARGDIVRARLMIKWNGK